MKRSTTKKKGPARKVTIKKVARLYHFEPQVVEHIEFLSTLFGGKEKGIAAAVTMTASVLRGEHADLRLSVK